MKGSLTPGARLVTMVTMQSDLTEECLTHFPSHARVGASFTVSASVLQRCVKPKTSEKKSCKDWWNAGLRSQHLITDAPLRFWFGRARASPDQLSCCLCWTKPNVISRQETVWGSVYEPRGPWDCPTPPPRVWPAAPSALQSFRLWERRNPRRSGNNSTGSAFRRPNRRITIMKKSLGKPGGLLAFSANLIRW